MSKYEEANLVLKLYELRREEVMRQARDWYFRDFHPTSAADYNAAMLGEHSGHLRMVLTYWDMAAALVKHGAISHEMFEDTNGECIGTFAKIEPILPELRAQYGPHVLANLEKVIDAMEGGRERTAKAREFIAGMRERLAGRTAVAS